MHSPWLKLTDSLLPDPPHFSLPSTFKYYKGRFVNLAECSSEHWFVLEKKAEYRNKVKTKADWMRVVQRDCVTGYNLSFWSQLRTTVGSLIYKRLRHAPAASLCQNLCQNFEPNMQTAAVHSITCMYCWKMSAKNIEEILNRFFLRTNIIFH